MQNRNGLIFLGIAVVLGAVAAFSAHRWVSNQTPVVVESVEMVEVVVPRSNLAIATTLVARQLDTVSWPKNHLPPGALQDVSQGEGRVVRRPVAVGEVLVETALFAMGAGGGLPAVITEKRRAISVKVDPVIGLAGFVKPGTRVDVLATLRRIDWKKPLPYSRTILQDIPVLAIDQKLEQVRDGEPELVSVVTLEVEPDQAQKLTYASHEGRIQLAMRSPSDEEVLKTKSISVAALMDSSRPRRSSKASVSRSSRVQIIRGAKSETKKF
jgi:pilus assembly protein CpaB